MPAIVSFESVTVHRGGHPVLVDVDLEVDPGLVVGVAGPNGSGKTTLVRTAATLLAPENGRVTILGETCPGGDTRAVRARSGLIGHQPALIPELTLEENLTHLARLRGEDTGRISKALEVVGLGEVSGRRADASSFGMKRRVEIAHVLLTKPDLLLLDEAASGLDADANKLVDAILSSVRERNGGALVVSHDRAQLGKWCDVVATIESGRVGAAS